ncbi:MAG: hypothetical protein ACYSTZ_04015 [Planctomycetota bacterium]|jgi:hypothetical protein
MEITHIDLNWFLWLGFFIYLVVKQKRIFRKLEEIETKINQDR